MSDFSAVYLERADDALAAAKLLMDKSLYSDSVSRSYYAAYYGVKAVLERLGCERKSHQSVWAAFGQLVAKQGLMDNKYHRGGLDLFDSRINSDYMPKPMDTEETAQSSLSFATDLVGACRAFLEKKDAGAA